MCEKDQPWFENQRHNCKIHNLELGSFLYRELPLWLEHLCSHICFPWRFIVRLPFSQQSDVCMWESLTLLCEIKHTIVKFIIFGSGNHRFYMRNMQGLNTYVRSSILRETCLKDKTTGAWPAMVIYLIVSSTHYVCTAQCCGLCLIHLPWRPLLENIL